LHVKSIDDFKKIYLQNLPDLNNLIDKNNTALLHWFYDLKTAVQLCSHESHIPKNHLLNSIHNTGRSSTKVALVHSSKYLDALGQLETLDTFLVNSIAKQYHSKVFLPGSKPLISGQRVDSISSCNYSSYASKLLGSFNPQDDNQVELPPHKKRFRQPQLSYATAVTDPVSTRLLAPAQIMPGHFDEVYSSLCQKLKDDLSPQLDILELEHQVEQTSTEITSIRASFEDQLAGVKQSVDQLAMQVDNQ
jgi:hypothetical protein